MGIEPKMRRTAFDDDAFAGEPTDTYGIPLSVRHAPQTALGVWQYVHQLETPIEDPRRPASPYTHVCLLCAEELQRDHSLVSPAAWTKALMRQRMSTNASKHLDRRHPDASVESRRRTTGAKRASLGGSGGGGGSGDADGLSAGFSPPSASPGTDPPPAKRARKMTKKQQLQALMKNGGDADASGADGGGVAVDRSFPTFQVPPAVPRPAPRQMQSASTRTAPDQILFLLHRWLISAGLPHEETRNEELQRLLAVASKAPALELAAPGTFDTHLEMEFAQFARGVEQYLARERAAACDRPFASLLGDVQSGSGGAHVLGLSVALVDAQWRHVVLPLAAQPLPVPAPGCERASTLSVSFQVIGEALREAYHTDVGELEKFSSVHADRTAALVQTRQEDDLMHAVSASVLHALGLVGAPAEVDEPLSVRWLEHALEKLLAFFQDPARRGKLFQIGEFYKAQPAALGEIAATTRLGYIYELFQRSCLNFATYSRFFATNAPCTAAGDAGADGGERVWQQLMGCDAWQMIAEVEAVLHQLTTQLDLGALHPRRVSSSYAHFFRRLLRVTLHAKSLKCLPLGELAVRPAANRGVDAAARESRPVEQLTAATRGFLSRLRSEIAKRFGESPAAGEIKAMLLDPRIKAKVASLVDNREEVDRADAELRSEHRAVFMALAAREAAAAGGEDARWQEQDQQQQKVEPAVTGGVDGLGHGDADSDEDEMSALLAMDGPSTRPATSHSSLGLAAADSRMGSENGEGDASAAAAQAAALAKRAAELELAETQAWQRWQALAVEWEAFASDGDIFLKNGQYNVVKLYQRVDVLAWFRTAGALIHPSVAVLARVYLGRPAVASAAHDAFVTALGDWDAVAVHTPTGVRREGRLRVLQCGWRQWKELAADEGVGGRRGGAGGKRGTVI